MITAPNVSPGDLGFGAFIKSNQPAAPALPPSSWQPPPRYYAGPPAAKPFTTSVSPGPVAVNRPPTVNTAYTPGANYRPVNRTATPAPSVSTPVASPVALKGVPRAPQFKAPQIPGAGNLGPALGAAAMLPLLAGAIGDAASDSARLQRSAFQQTQTLEPGRIAGVLFFGGLMAAPGAAAGIASNFRPKGIPDWLWPFPDPPGPNDLDPAAMDEGAVITSSNPTYGDPPFTGGQSAGVLYDVRITNGQSSTTGSIVFNQNLIGPIGAYSLIGTGIIGAGGLERKLFRVHHSGGFTDSNSQFGRTDDQWALFKQYASRADGQPDTGGNILGPQTGVTEADRAQNPARQVQSDAPPRTLPQPTPTPDSTGLPWPQTAPQAPPQPAPFAEPPPAPNFTPTPTPDPLPPTAPGTTPVPTDLDAPRETPPNLADDPLTPPVIDPLEPIDETKPTGWLVNGKPSNTWGSRSTVVQVNDVQQQPETEGGNANKLNPINFTTAALAVAVPVVLLDGLKQKVNTPSANLTDKTATNPNIEIVTPPPVQIPPTPQPPTCIYERQRVMDIQNKTTDVQAKASNPVSGFPGLYGLQIEARTKLGQTFTLLEGVNTFMRKAWETTRIQKVLDLLTFVGVMHNVSMLSRDVGETFFQLIGQGIQSVGIRDEEDNVIDVGEVVGNTVENFLRGILGDQVYEGVGETWNKANRIISSASMIIWTVRSISDSSLDLMEWIGENTGRIGNALKRWGVVGERSYPWMSESAKAQSRFRNRFSKVTNALENTEDRLSVYMQATSAVIEVQEETQQLGESWQQFRASVEEGIPDPWGDNVPVKAGYDANKAISDGPDVLPAESQKG